MESHRARCDAQTAGGSGAREKRAFVVQEDDRDGTQVLVGSAGQRSAGSNTYGVSGLPNICLVLITPDSSEIRWVPAVPEPGARLPGRFPGEWLVVDEVLQSGVMTYTVFSSPAPEGRMDQAIDLAAGALDRVQESVPTTLRPSRLSS